MDAAVFGIGAAVGQRRHPVPACPARHGRTGGDHLPRAFQADHRAGAALGRYGDAQHCDGAVRRGRPEVLAVDVLGFDRRQIGAIGPFQLAAAGLPKDQRTKAILVGIIAATILRITFALVATQLLAIIGLLFAGGVLLLWVCWKMWRELSTPHSNDPEAIEGKDLDGDGKIAGQTISRTSPSARCRSSRTATFPSSKAAPASCISRARSMSLVVTAPASPKARSQGHRAGRSLRQQPRIRPRQRAGRRKRAARVPGALHPRRNLQIASRRALRHPYAFAVGGAVRRELDHLDRERVIERFVRLDQSRSKPGNGLGLSLVSGVMKLHKGTLLLEDNAPGLKASLVLPVWRE